MSQATTLQPSQEVRSALEGCAEEVRVRARNFWYGMRLLPRERFHALCAVYSWMRRADDLADGDVGLDASERARSLASYRERTHEIFTHGMYTIKQTAPIEPLGSSNPFGAFDFWA